MINAINSVGNNVYKKQNVAFGQTADIERVVKEQSQMDMSVKKRSKAGGFFRYVATQVVAGALFSAIWDGAVNLFRIIGKKKDLIPMKEIAKRAGAMGVLFAVVGLVFSGVAGLFAKRNNK